MNGPDTGQQTERRSERPLSLSSPLLWPVVFGAALTVLGVSLFLRTSTMLSPAGAVGTLAVFMALAAGLVIRETLRGSALEADPGRELEAGSDSTPDLDGERPEWSERESTLEGVTRRENRSVDQPSE